MTPDGNRLLVGAPGTEGASAGTIYYYERSGSSWNVIYTIPGIADSAENFGTTVSIISKNDGNVIAVGAPNYGGGRGVIRVYRALAGTFWNQEGSDIVGEPGDRLGTTLAAGPNNRIVAGTASTGSFRVYEFDVLQNDWVRVGSGEPTLGSGVTSIASSESGDVALGTSDGQVVVYGL